MLPPPLPGAVAAAAAPAASGAAATAAAMAASAGRCFAAAKQLFVAAAGMKPAGCCSCMAVVGGSNRSGGAVVTTVHADAEAQVASADHRATDTASTLEGSQESVCSTCTDTDGIVYAATCSCRLSTCGLSARLQLHSSSIPRARREAHGRRILHRGAYQQVTH
eukprot:15467522-Alexandrium_andersonii.AAC.2